MKNETKNKTLIIVTLGILIAINVLLSRFVSINAWNMKIGFTFLATYMGAYIFGPIGGIIVGGLGDLIGALLFPIGPYFPGFTLNCALSGLIMGLLLYKKFSKFRLAITVAIDQLAISMFLTTLWISILYGSEYWPIFVSRIVQILIMIVLEYVIILVITPLLNRIKAKDLLNRRP